MEVRSSQHKTHPPKIDTSTRTRTPHRRQPKEAPTTLEQVVNRGPLTSIYLALFGNASFPASFASSPHATYLASTTSAGSNRSTSTCADLFPLGGMLRHDLDCLAPGWSSPPQVQLNTWLASLFDTPSVGNTLNISAFLANELWLTGNRYSSSTTSRTVEVDRAVDVLAPVMPLAGVIVGTVLLGTFLLGLLALVVFAAQSPHWTDTLDALAMVRVGAATEGLTVLGRIGRGEDLLDRLPGWVGDAVPEGEVGRLAVGAEGALSCGGGRRYEKTLFAVVRE